jgi:predicted metal-dependent phosphoesterase TrpH
MIDLHTHSVYSDGSNTPAELVEMAVGCGLNALALTDHDTVGGIIPFLEAADKVPLEAVPGIELSAECARGTMHILGYFIDHTSSLLLKKIERVQEERHARNQEILKKLNKLGYVVTWDDVKCTAGSDVVGRPHFAQALVKRGHVKSKKAAFELLLAKGRRAYADRYHYTATECIEIIREAGGVSVLAHPATVRIPDDQLRGLVYGMKEKGLGGIEVYCSSYQVEHVKKFSKWADELNLICTGGTDFHGANTPDLKLGVGFGQLNVSDEVLDQLKAAVK